MGRKVLMLILAAACTVNMTCAGTGTYQIKTKKK